MSDLEVLYNEIQELIKGTNLKSIITPLHYKRTKRITIKNEKPGDWMSIWHNGVNFEIWDKLVMYEDDIEKITKEEILTRIKTIIK